MSKIVHDFRWSTIKIAKTPATMPVTTDFFAGNPSTDPCVSRYSSPNNLCDSGVDFIIKQIGLQIICKTANALTDFAKILDFCQIRFSTKGEDLFTVPCMMLPQGGGLYAPGGQVSITPGLAGVPATESIIGATNGVPDRRAMFAPATEVRVGYGQNFKAELLAPASGSLFDTVTLTEDTLLRLIFDGYADKR
jgi:hypothetical protein